MEIRPCYVFPSGTRKRNSAPSVLSVPTRLARQHRSSPEHSHASETQNASPWLAVPTLRSGHHRTAHVVILQEPRQQRQTLRSRCRRVRWLGSVSSLLRDLGRRLNDRWKQRQRRCELEMACTEPLWMIEGTVWWPESDLMMNSMVPDISAVGIWPMKVAANKRFQI